MNWIQAVAHARSKGVFTGKIPKKGSEEYHKIKALMGKAPKKAKAEKAPKAPKKAPRKKKNKVEEVMVDLEL